MASACQKLELIKNTITAVPDFPKPGILFRDILPVLLKPDVYKTLMDVMIDHVAQIKPPVQAVAALEARGFLFGPSIALHFNIPFLPIRKRGKLPGKVVAHSYKLEYGEDTIEIQDGVLEPNTRVVIVDDVLATGGTLHAAVDLLKQCKYDVVESFVAIELTGLNGRCQVPGEVKTLLEF